MSFLMQANDPAAVHPRRMFLGRSGLLLSGAAVALMAGRDALAAGKAGDAGSDVQILNTAFLANPAKLVPGTSMTYAGVPDRAERAALIAYLKQANDGSECHDAM